MYGYVGSSLLPGEGDGRAGGGGRAWARRGGTVRLGAAGGQDDPRSGSLGGKWGFDGGLWTGGRRRLFLPGFCAEHTGTAFRELDVEGDELPRRTWNPEP